MEDKQQGEKPDKNEDKMGKSDIMYQGHQKYTSP